MKSRYVLVLGAVALGLCLATPGAEAGKRQTKPQPLPGPRERCTNQCDTKFTQCFDAGTPQGTCVIEKDQCYKACESEPVS